MARELCSKMSLLLTSQIFSLFVNTLATHEESPDPNRDNLTIPIQMQLFEKRRTISQIFAEFFISI